MAAAPVEPARKVTATDVPACSNCVRPDFLGLDWKLVSEPE